MKTGLVITASGLSGAFNCGVLEQWTENGVRFPFIVGTGFGALMGAYVHAGQGAALGNLYRHFIKTYGDDLDLFGNFKGEERAVNGTALFELADEVDMDAFHAADGRVSAATTRADNGDGVFWPLERAATWKQLAPYLRAAMTFPGADEPVSLVERAYFDGRIAEPLPISMALEHGCDRLVVVQNKMATVPMKRHLLTPTQALLFKDMPKLRNVYWLSHLHYNDEMRRLLELQRQGRAIIVAPEINSAHRSRYGVSMSATSEYYNEGLRLGEAALSRVQAFLEGEQ